MPPSGKRLEDQLQRMVLRWLRLQHPEVLVFHVPNGGLRAKAEACIMKGLGVVAGVPDLVLCFPGGVCRFLELKSERGRLSVSQAGTIERLTAMGFDVAVVRDLDEAVTVVNGWVRADG